MGEFLIYGATGYTGQLVAEHAAASGLRPVLAGRSRERLRTLANRFGLEWRVFALETPAEVRDGLKGMAAVLHTAGPFSATSKPMADACMGAGAHYIDITGEIDVFEALAARDGEAKAAGIMLLPGAGFDVVPSDCLAAHVKSRVPEATQLRLSIGGLAAMSRGTAKTAAEAIASGTRIRRAGQIIALTNAPRATADFGSGTRPTIGVSWGDVATAWYSTHIPDIEVYFEASRQIEQATRIPRIIKRLIAVDFVQGLIKRQIERRIPPGPTLQQRMQGRSFVIAEAWDAAGKRLASCLETPEAYTLTALTAVEIAHRAATGEVRLGYQTPSTAFGADFVLQFRKVLRTDLCIWGKAQPVSLIQEVSRAKCVRPCCTSPR